MENGNVQRYSRHVYYDANEQEYVALCSEFPHVSAFGETAEEALAELEVVLEGAVEVHRDEGWPIPEPIAPPEPQGLPSGKFVVRLPRTLHARLVRRANRDGVSLNALVIALLAEGDTVRAIEDRLETLAATMHAREMRSHPIARTTAQLAPKNMDLIHDARGAWRDEDRSDLEESWSDTPPGVLTPIIAIENAQEVLVN